jgi:hypothetical protein
LAPIEEREKKKSFILYQRKGFKTPKATPLERPTAL